MCIYSSKTIKQFCVFPVHFKCHNALDCFRNFLQVSVNKEEQRSCEADNKILKKRTENEMLYFSIQLVLKEVRQVSK